MSIEKNPPEKNWFDSPQEWWERFSSSPAGSVEKMIGTGFRKILRLDSGYRWIEPTIYLYTDVLPRLTALESSRITDWNMMRQVARSDFSKFITLVKPEYQWADHHRVLSTKLQEVVTGVKRLGISLPPRHGKSEQAAIMTPAWYLGCDPTARIILVSHSQELANSFSRTVRRIISHDLIYRNLFPGVSLSEERRAVNHWMTTEGGEFRAVGAGSSISGHGADLLILDDPHKDDDWRSTSRLNEVYEWYVSAARTRLSSGGSIILISTRWHVQDIVGQIQARDEGEWDWIDFPAFAGENDLLSRESGEPLWPDRFNKDWLNEQRKASPVLFDVQYQNNPTALSAFMFDTSDLVQYQQIANRCDFITCDFALGLNETSDYTVFCRWIQTSPDTIVLTGLSRERMQVSEAMRLLKEQLSEYNCNTVVFPDDPIEKTIKEMARGILGDCRIVVEKMRGDKKRKALLFADLLKSGKVGYHSSASGLKEFIHEIADFPNSANDDIIDCCSLAAHYIKRGRFEVVQ